MCENTAVVKTKHIGLHGANLCRVGIHRNTLQPFAIVHQTDIPLFLQVSQICTRLLQLGSMSFAWTSKTRARPFTLSTTSFPCRNLAAATRCTWVATAALQVQSLSQSQLHTGPLLSHCRTLAQQYHVAVAHVTESCKARFSKGLLSVPLCRRARVC